MTTSRVQELEGLINKARHDYYNELPTVSDETYDAWVDELAELNANSVAVSAIGAPVPVSGWQKAEHGFVMGSLDKVNTGDELVTWLRGLEREGSLQQYEMLMVTEKLDGISIHLRYANGVFVQAITRGDGSQGEDISQNVVKMKGVLARIEGDFTGSLRGEIVLTKSDHAKHFAGYANPRNAASGVSKRYDGEGSQHLSVKVYQVVSGRDFENEADQYEWLEAQGFSTPNWYVTAVAPGVKTPHDLWYEYQQSKRVSLDYEIDGLVVRLNSFLKQAMFGEKDGRPRAAVAFKFAPITRESVLRRIDWQVGGTGRITPVAVFDPVSLLGTTVTNASVYNYKYIRDLSLDIGAKVIIARANDVIPRVVSVRAGTGTVAWPPSNCPSCNHAVQAEGEYLVCPNSQECPAQTAGRIQRYVKELDIKEWGDTLIEKLTSGGLVKTPADLYKLTLEQLAGLDRMGEKSAQTLLKTLWDRNPIALEDLLGSLSIPGIAPSSIRMCMDAGLDTWASIQDASLSRLEKVSGFGPVKASSLHNWVRDGGQTLVQSMLEAGVKIREKVVGSLTGKSFCFTGAMKNKRADLEAVVVDKGGVVKASVTKGLTYLVIADPASTSTKAQTARKNGTKCISEDEFLRMAHG